MSTAYTTSESTLVKSYEHPHDPSLWSQVHKVWGKDGEVSYWHTYASTDEHDSQATPQREYRSAVVADVNEQPAVRAHYALVEAMHWGLS